MKKAIVTGIIAVLGSQMAMAANTYCGASVETVKGSHVYDKKVFLDKVESTKAIQRYLLPDGTVLKAEDLKPETLAKIADGSVAFNVTFVDSRPQLFIAIVKKDSKGQVNFVNVAFSTGFDSQGAMLIANDASLFCKDL